MSKIAIDRAVLQNLLAACEARLPLIGQTAIIEELNALRAALEQTPVKIDYRAECWPESPHYRPQQPQVEQETKSYKVTGKTGEFCVFHSTEVKRGDMVYTHPQPPRQPLTDDEINTIWRNSTHMTIVEVVRAIEAAHGIGGES